MAASLLTAFGRVDPSNDAGRSNLSKDGREMKQGRSENGTLHAQVCGMGGSSSCTCKLMMALEVVRRVWMSFAILKKRAPYAAVSLFA